MAKLPHAKVALGLKLSARHSKDRVTGRERSGWEVLQCPVWGGGGLSILDSSHARTWLARRREEISLKTNLHWQVRIMTQINWTAVTFIVSLNRPNNPLLHCHRARCILVSIRLEIQTVYSCASWAASKLSATGRVFQALFGSC